MGVLGIAMEFGMALFGVGRNWSFGYLERVGGVIPLASCMRISFR